MKRSVLLVSVCLAAVGCGSDRDAFNDVVLAPTATATLSSTSTLRDPDIAGPNTSGVRNPGATNPASSTSSPDEPSTLVKGARELPPDIYIGLMDQVKPDRFDSRGAFTEPLAVLPVRASVRLAPPVADQGQTGSCSAHSAYLLGSQAEARRSGAAPDSPERFTSRAWLYRKILADENPDGDIFDPQDGSLMGSYILSYLEQLVQQGCPSEAEVPYPSVQLPFAEMERSIQNIDYTSPRTFKFLAGSYALIKGTDGNDALDQIKRNLATDHPVGFTTLLADDFNDYASGVYTAKLPFQPGAHSMALVGYDDEIAYTRPDGAAARGAFRVQNSWNPTGWGEAGYAWMSYEAFLRSTQDGSPEYYALDPVLQVAQDASGGSLTTNGNAGDGAVLQTRQITEDGKILLVLSASFAQAHALDQVDLVQPNGAPTVRQTLKHQLFRSGHLQFARSDGQQFPAGSYTVRFHYEAGGTSSATVTVGALAGSALPAAALDGQGEQGASGQPLVIL